MLRNFSFLQPRQNLLNAASRVGEASTSVLYTIGEETEEDKEIQVNIVNANRSQKSKNNKKSFLYRKLNYCVDNFYKAFFGNKTKHDDYGSDFGTIIIDDESCNLSKHAEDEGIYEDIDTSNTWGRMLDVIQEESDSDYYRSLEYCNTYFKPSRPVTLNEINQNKTSPASASGSSGDFEAILENCEGYLDNKNPPSVKLPPKTTSEKIYDLKKDFSDHDYVNINFNRDGNVHDYANIDVDRRTKNQILRERFFLSGDNDKNDINDKFNRYNNYKRIESQSIRSDTKSGPNVNSTDSIHTKILNIDKYNRTLTTKETFKQTVEASFAKKELNLKHNDDLETFIKRSEKYYTSETRDRSTTVELNNTKTPPKGKTEIRIFYNPTFAGTEAERARGPCQFCKQRCPRTEEKCCPDCVCLEIQLGRMWRENWLNILCVISLLFVLLLLLVQSFMPGDDCLNGNANLTDGKCFEMY